MYVCLVVYGYVSLFDYMTEWLAAWIADFIFLKCANANLVGPQVPICSYYLQHKMFMQTLIDNPSKSV